MNYTIWKYEIQPDDYNKIKMPADSKILSIHTQHGVPCMWVLVNTKSPLVERVFEVFGTGHRVPVDMGIRREFIGTFLVNGDSLVFHVFERTD